MTSPGLKSNTTDSPVLAGPQICYLLYLTIPLSSGFWLSPALFPKHTDACLYLSRELHPASYSGVSEINHLTASAPRPGVKLSRLPRGSSCDFGNKIYLGHLKKVCTDALSCFSEHTWDTCTGQGEWCPTVQKCQRRSLAVLSILCALSDLVSR